MSELSRTKIDRRLIRKTDGVFRVISWNTEGEHQQCQGQNERLVDFLVMEVGRYSANVICLQEMMGKTFDMLEKRLEALDKSWSCFFDWKEISKGQEPSHYWPHVLGLAICVLGRGSDFKWNYFSSENGEPWRDYARRYVQLNYKGVQITNVHTSSYWKEQHVKELHQKVTQGIIAGDFNHPSPDERYPSMWTYDPAWHQTDLTREWTHPNGGNHIKMDHILAIDEPEAIEGGARDLAEGGSDHRLIFGGILFTKKEPRPGGQARPNQGVVAQAEGGKEDPVARTREKGIPSNAVR